MKRRDFLALAGASEASSVNSSPAVTVMLSNGRSAKLGAVTVIE